VRPPQFRTFLNTCRGVATVKFAGELDMATVPDAEDALRDALTAGCHRIVIDLRELDFMDSTGITLLVRWDLGARNDGYNLALIPGGDHIQRLLALTGLDRHFTFEEPG
jgi:anti-sigma B factor antagonist